MWVFTAKMQEPHIHLEKQTIQLPEFSCSCRAKWKQAKISQKYQKHKIGTKTLEKIINETRQLTDVLPIRFITINAVPDKIEWYKKIGFQEMGKDIDNINKYMYIDLIKDKQKLVDYCDEKLSCFM